jgi:hypothetical protein
VGADSVAQANDSPLERRLRQLDAMLDALEDLNLNGMRFLPVRVGSALIDLGIENPYRWSITQLIDKVLELQQPLLKTKSNALWRRPPA